MKRLYITILVLYALKPTGAASLQESKTVTCREQDKVSAIVESYLDPEVALLFSAQYVYHFRPKTGSLEDVDEISELFQDVFEKIEAAFQSYILDVYCLYSANKVYHWNRTTRSTTTYSYNSHKQFVHNNTRFDLDKHLTCAASYCGMGDNCFFVAIVNMQKIIQCTHSRGIDKRFNCGMSEAIKYPDGSSPRGATLSGCQGIMIKENLIGDGQFGLVLADSEKLRFWVGEKLMFDANYEQIFDCSSSWLIVAVIAVLGIAVVLIGTPIAIAGCRCFRRGRGKPHEFRSLTTKSSKDPRSNKDLSESN